MSERELSVACFGQIAGTLVDREPTMTFAYSDEWIASAKPPLSQSLPLDGTFSANAAEAFFGGLLPEGVPRATIASQLGVSERNSFSLLLARR